MPTYTSPVVLSQKQKAAFGTFLWAARERWREIPGGAFRDLKELTSGTISSRELARRGHPYARRHAAKRYARGSAPLLPINRQTSRLHNSVSVTRRSSGFALAESVGFDAGRARRSIFAVLPQGTRYVVPRGLWKEVGTRAIARQKTFRDDFFRAQRYAFSKP